MMALAAAFGLWLGISIGFFAGASWRCLEEGMQ
jgi:hypothetical protein